jgi:hypothetical protein
MMALLLRSTSPQLAYSVVSLAGGNSVAFGLKRSSVLRVHGLCIASSLLQRQPLTMVTEMVTFAYHRSRRDLSRGYFRKWNEGGSRARGYDPRPGGSGHHSRRYYGRCGRCFPWTGTGEGG